MTAIKELISEIEFLEPVPAVLHQITAKSEDPNASMMEIADIIMFDPILTANVLKMVNSAYFALPRKIDSVKEAITILGLDQVVDMVILKAGSKNFSRAQNGYGLNEGELWRCAVASAIISREIAIQLGLSHIHMIFTAAMIKDIGKIILDRFVADAFHKISRLVNEKAFSFKEAEKKVIGVDHAEIGAYVAKKWGFSHRLVGIIKNHHLSDPDRKDTETGVVYLADNVCMMMGIGVGHDGLSYRFHEEMLNKLGVSPDDLQRIIAGFGAMMENVERLLQVT